MEAEPAPEPSPQPRKRPSRSRAEGSGKPSTEIAPVAPPRSGSKEAEGSGNGSGSAPRRRRVAASPRPTSAQPTLEDATEPAKPERPPGRHRAVPAPRRTAPPASPPDAEAPDPAATRVYVSPPEVPETGPRATRVYLARVGPLSMLKLSLIFLTGIVAAIVAGLFVLYQVLDATGVLRDIEEAVNKSGLGEKFRFDAAAVFVPLLWGAAAFVVALSLLACRVAVIYNAVSDLVGGLDVTLVEREQPREEIVVRTESIAMTRSATVPSSNGKARGRAARRAASEASAREPEGTAAG